MNTNIQTGFFLIGIFKGYRSTPWKNDPTKFNHRIGIATLFDDGYGGVKENIVEVDIMSDDIPRITQEQAQLTGKMVRLHVVPQAKGKAWLSCFMPKGTQITVLVTEQKPEQKPELKKAS